MAEKSKSTAKEITEIRRCPMCNSLNTRFVGKVGNKKKVCNSCPYDEREEDLE